MISYIILIVVPFSPDLVSFPSISVCLKPKEEELISGTQNVSPDAPKMFKNIVNFTHHPLVVANIPMWDEELAKANGSYSGLGKISFSQSDIAGNKTLENIVSTWTAFVTDVKGFLRTVALQCMTVDPPTKSKPGITNQVLCTA